MERIEASAQNHSGILPYLLIARPDNWFKNVFMIAGMILALFFRQNVQGGAPPFRTDLWILAFVSLCLIASGNYVINGILDAETDKFHPYKRHRPIPSGAIRVSLAYVEWLLLIAAGLALGWLVNKPFAVTLALLFGMGVVYNVRPFRSKEIPYIDVLSESVNNPLRLLLGWFLILPHVLPPLSLIITFWMAGAFFMASKRFAEYRSIGSPEIARSYRSSFRYYNERNLLLSLFFYAASTAFFLGVFITHYRVELILMIPLLAGFLTYYLAVTLRVESTAQNPEKLYRERGLMFYLMVCTVFFVLLMSVDIPSIGRLFNIQGPMRQQLWTIDEMSRIPTPFTSEEH